MDVLTNLFSTFGVNWQKFGAQVILFGLVYWILNRFAFGPILEMLHERRRRIEESQQNAEKIKRQLAEAELRYQEILRKANEDAQRLLDEARASSEAQTRKAAQQAIHEAEGILARARAAIELERAKVMAEVRQEIAALVAATTAKVAGKVLTPEDHRRLAEETAKELAA